MLVRITSRVRVPGLSRDAEPGEVWDLPADDAARMIHDGDAVPVTIRELDRSKVETR